MSFYVYITTTKSNTALYTGMTGDLGRRIREHSSMKRNGFTQRYRVNKLVYYEIFETSQAARQRERQIKSGSREKKIDLIRGFNSKWEDLSESL